MEFECRFELTEFIDKMNEMFEVNGWTDGSRVTVDYAKNCGVIVVKVLNKVEVLDISTLTEYGIMFAIMDKVKEMYDAR